jgi:hypothetical protein
MNFTPFDTINEAINAGAKFWSVYDQSGKRLIFELNQDTAPEDSAEKLKSILHREQGEFVQVKLGFQSSKDKGNGGNVRGFTYFYKLPNPGGSITGAPVGFSAGFSGGGVPWSEYISVYERANRAAREIDRLQFTMNQAPSFADRIAEPENLNKIFNFVDGLVNSLGPKKPQAAGALSAPDQNTDAELNAAVETLTGFTDGRQALINIAAAGPMVWSVIHQGLKENSLLP